MKKFFFDCGTRDTTASFGLLILRVLIGSMMFFGHGLDKLKHFSSLKMSFTVAEFPPLNYLSPQANLIACLIGEVVAPLLLILGLASRPAAFLLGFTMVVAAIQVAGNAPMFLGPGVSAAKEPALLYIVPMIALIFSGAGAFSLDANLYQEKRNRRW